MEPIKSSPEAQAKEGASPKEECLKGTCPFCLSEIDVHLDIKDRPYWRCWRCEVRMFGTKTAMKSLKADGWIWTDERPLEDLRAWLKRVAVAVGLNKRIKK
jgi:hypothetical protein